MVALIPETMKNALRNLLLTVQGSVNVIALIPKRHEMFDLWINFVSELKQIHEKLHVNTIIIDDYTHVNLNVSMFPALVINGKNIEIRFYDLPIGLEMVMFIDALHTVINEMNSDSVKDYGTKHIVRIFSSPTCSRCIPVGRIVFGFALLSKCCIIEIMDILEHADLLAHHGILTVPVIMIENEILYKELNEENIILFLTEKLLKK